MGLMIQCFKKCDGSVSNHIEDHFKVTLESLLITVTFWAMSRRELTVLGRV